MGRNVKKRKKMEKDAGKQGWKNMFCRPLFKSKESLSKKFEYPDAGCFVAIYDRGKSLPIEEGYMASEKDREAFYRARAAARSLEIFQDSRDAEAFLNESHACVPGHSYILGMKGDAVETSVCIDAKEGFGRNIKYAIDYTEVIEVRSNPKAADVKIIWTSLSSPRP